MTRSLSVAGIRSSSTSQPGENGPVGLGGWLGLPIFGLLITPLVAALQGSFFFDIGEVWSSLSFTEQLFVSAEICVNVLLNAVAPVLLLVLAFRRSSRFPMLYIAWAAMVPIVIAADAILGYWMFRSVFDAAGEGMFDKETVRSLTRSVWGAAIWIPYMLLSKRVKNTFLRHH